MKNYEKVIGVRVNKKTHTLLKKVVDLRGEDISDFARRAFNKELAELGLLDEEAKQALGLKAKG